MEYANSSASGQQQEKEAEKPIPKDNEVLIKVHAASVITLDLAMRGPILTRIIDRATN